MLKFSFSEKIPVMAATINTSGPLTTCGCRTSQYIECKTSVRLLFEWLFRNITYYYCAFKYLNLLNKTKRTFLDFSISVFRGEHPAVVISTSHTLSTHTEGEPKWGEPQADMRRTCKLCALDPPQERWLNKQHHVFPAVVVVQLNLFTLV